MEKPIRLFKVRMADDIDQHVVPVLKSGYIGEGPKVKEFESLLAKRFRNNFTLTTNSATSAEHLALHLLKKPCTVDVSDADLGIWGGYNWPGLRRGDEVLATPLTCTATNWPILANGLKIKWVDVDPLTMNMDLDDLERKISSRTKIIMPVHWGGYPLDLERLHDICRMAEIACGFRPMVIQDCAHALGTLYNGRPITTYGDICTFSFQAIKHMTCGDGGALVLPYKNLYDRGKLVRWYGIDREGPRTDFRCEADIPEWGFKFHMNDISAAIGLANISHLSDTLSRHRTNAAYYYNTLFQAGISLPPVLNATSESAWWLFTLRVERRDDFMRAMADRGIEVSRVHERNDKHSCVAEFATELPGVDQAVSEMACIPVGWWIGQEEREYIVDSIKRGW